MISPTSGMNRTNLKRFTHPQIGEKIAARTNVPEYETLLMACAVTRDDDGVVFDSSLPEWKTLVAKCAAADRRDKERVAAATQSNNQQHVQSNNQSTIQSNQPISQPVIQSPPSQHLRSTSSQVASSFLSKMGKVGKMITAKSPEAADAVRTVNEKLVTREIPAEGQSEDWISIDRKKSNHPSHHSNHHHKRPHHASRAHAHEEVSEPGSSHHSNSHPHDLSSAVASPSRVRVPLVKAVDRATIIRLKRGTARELKDSSFVQADVAFETRLWREIYSDDNAIIEEWRHRRGRELEREAQLKQVEEEEEKARLRAGGKKKRKLAVAPPPPIVDRDGNVIGELDYMRELLTELSADDWSSLDWSRIRAFTRVTGIPAKYRWRVWHHLLGLPCEHEPFVNPVVNQSEAAPLTSTTDTSDLSITEQSEQSADVDQLLNSQPGRSADPAQSPSLSPLTEDEELTNTPRFDLSNQRVIRVDIDRTLPHLHTMQNPAVKHELEAILTEHCKTHSCGYKQGMNYLLAPLFFLTPHAQPIAGTKTPAASENVSHDHLNNQPDINLVRHRPRLQSLYAALIAKFLPNTFNDDEFGSLQCIFLWFRHMLLYTDPQLASHLDKSDIGPELYASSWFLTLHANRCKLEVTLSLWDQLILEAEALPRLHYHVSLALLIAHRIGVLKESSVADLPQTLSKIALQSRRDVNILCQRARLIYMPHTPRSFIDRLKDLTGTQPLAVDGPEFNQLTHTPCLSITSAELCSAIVEAQQKQSAKQAADHNAEDSEAPLRYFVLDCRSLEDYSCGHLPMSLHLDPALIDDPRRYEELEATLSAIGSMRGRHLCLLDENGDIGQAGEQSPLINWLSLLLGRNLRYTSLVEGGYAACHAYILNLDRSTELIDHNPELCLQCNGRAVNKREKKGLFASVRRLGVALIRSQQGEGIEVNEETRRDTVPNSVTVLPSTNQLRLLLTSLRDRRSADRVFADSTSRIISILVGAALERFDVREKQVKTNAGGLYSGIEAENRICCIGLSDMAIALLSQAWKPYEELVPCVKVQASVNEYGHCDLSLPESSQDSPVLICLPVLNQKSQQELLVLIQHLLAQGLTSSITVVAAVAARPALWAIDDAFPTLRFIVAGVDELKVTKGQPDAVLVPGVFELERRCSDYVALLPSSRPEPM